MPVRLEYVLVALEFAPSIESSIMKPLFEPLYIAWTCGVTAHEIQPVPLGALTAVPTVAGCEVHVTDVSVQAAASR